MPKAISEAEFRSKVAAVNSAPVNNAHGSSYLTQNQWNFIEKYIQETLIPAIGSAFGDMRKEERERVDGLLAERDQRIADLEAALAGTGKKLYTFGD